MDKDTTQNNESALPSVDNPELTEASTLAKLSNQVNELRKQNEQLQEAKSKYYDQILNGSTAQVAEKKTRSISEIREDLIKSLDHDVTNLDYCKLAVELDDAVRENAEKHNKQDSAFLPKGKQVDPTVDEYNTANKMNNILHECIDECGDDPEKFNMLLNSRMSKR